MKAALLATMAIEVCSEISSPGFSPRISFSHDLDKTNPVPKQGQRSDSSLLDSSPDFDFCIVNNIKVELSSADELFSNGKILPVQIKRNLNSIAAKKTHQPDETVSPPTTHHSTARHTDKKKKRLKEFLDTSADAEEYEKPPAKPFWQFGRSSSLNCDTARGKSLIRPLQFLSRSNSTGSAPSTKQTVLPKETHQKQLLQKQPSVSSRRSSSSSSSCSSTYYAYNNSGPQKPSLRKSGSYGNGVRISPVLNLPPPYISKVTVSFFGFGSLFCNGKLKNKKK